MKTNKTNKTNKKNKLQNQLWSLAVCLLLMGFLLFPLMLENGALIGGTVLMAAAAGVFLVKLSRMGWRFSSVVGLLHQQLSGSRPLVTLCGLYILTAGCNLFYSPIGDELGAVIPGVIGGLFMSIILLFYVTSVDRLDNILMSITGAGLFTALCAVLGMPLIAGPGAVEVMLTAAACGVIFFLCAGYRRMFKATVVPTLCGVLGVGVYSGAQRILGEAVLIGAVDTDKRVVVSSGFSLLQEFGAVEMLLGRGGGYDISVSGFAGVQNFLLADLLNGGMVRFTLSLSLWLCIGYCIGILFLYRRGIPVIYLLVFSGLFLHAMLLSKYSFLTSPTFLLFCTLLVLELTLLKKGRGRFPMEEAQWS